MMHLFFLQRQSDSMYRDNHKQPAQLALEAVQNAIQTEADKEQTEFEGMYCI
jgi:hypothetical protein